MNKASKKKCSTELKSRCGVSLKGATLVFEVTKLTDTVESS